MQNVKSTVILEHLKNAIESPNINAKCKMQNAKCKINGHSGAFEKCDRIPLFFPCHSELAEESPKITSKSQ